MRMGNALADTVIARHRKRLKGRVRRITVEIDPTDDPTHGAQQLSFFNGHYDTWCYLPVAGFVRFYGEPEQYQFAYLLRPGNADAKLCAVGLLRRILARVRAAFPRARVLVRLDGGFAGPEMFDYLEAEGVDYVVAMGGNAVLKSLAEPADEKGAAPVQAQPSDRAPLRRVPVRGPQLEPQTPGDHQGQGGSPRWSRSQ
jgi:hypothetical protein